MRQVCRARALGHAAARAGPRALPTGLSSTAPLPAGDYKVRVGVWNGNTGEKGDVDGLDADVVWSDLAGDAQSDAVEVGKAPQSHALQCMGALCQCTAWRACRLLGLPALPAHLPVSTAHPLGRRARCAGPARTGVRRRRQQLEGAQHFHDSLPACRQLCVLGVPLLRLPSALQSTPWCRQQYSLTSSPTLLRRSPLSGPLPRAASTQRCSTQKAFTPQPAPSRWRAARPRPPRTSLWTPPAGPPACTGCALAAGGACTTCCRAVTPQRSTLPLARTQRSRGSLRCLPQVQVWVVNDFGPAQSPESLATWVGGIDAPGGIELQSAASDAITVTFAPSAAAADTSRSPQYR